MYNFKKIKHINYCLTTTILILLVIIQLNGCTTTEIAKIDTRQVNSTTTDYYLRTGDNLDIKFFITPELNESVTIRPDGKISLQLIDDVNAEGLTCSELDNILTEKYEKHLNKTLLTVIVKDFAGQKIYVGGEVNSPGIIELTGKVNALQAIFQSGGFKVDAKEETVLIVSRGPNNKAIARSVNLKKALKGKLPESDYLLKPFDMVFVPKTRLARTDEFLAKIYRIIPHRIWRGFTYETGDNWQIDWGETFYDY